uniref:Uncharacterized protein n=1 Tax=Meloidogyne incognita TaxID=6306 RepID=A0A914MTV0_MELIC
MFGDNKQNVILDILTNQHFRVILSKILQVKWNKHFLLPTEFLLLLSQRKLKVIQDFWLITALMKTIVDEYIEEIFGEDYSHKLCIYTRRGDFGPPANPRHHPTRKDFTEESTKFVFNEIKEKLKNKEISLILLGADKKISFRFKFLMEL